MKKLSRRSTRKKKQRTKDFSRICEAIRKGKSFLITSHVNPEGDSVSTLLALHSILRRLGKKVLILCEDPLPERFGFLGKHEWIDEKNYDGKFVFDTCFVVDCPSEKRIGRVFRHIGPGITVINLDHHISNESFGDVNLVDKDASSCGEIIYGLVRSLHLKLTREEAVYLYVSMSTDTGSFRYGNTTARTHRIVAELLENGLDIEELNERISEAFSRGKVRLYSFLLNNIHYEFGGKVAWTSLNRREMIAYGVSAEDTEGFIDFIRMIRGVKVAFFITDEGDGPLRISFRSKGEFNVNRLAHIFKGGGHKKAAGCNFRGTVTEAVKRILSEIKKFGSK